MIFRDEAHKVFYTEALHKCKSWDTYHKALCYCLGINEETRLHVNQIFDFKTDCIIPECINAGWQTSGSLNVTRLALNLYTDTVPISAEAEKNQDRAYRELSCFTVSDIFACSYAPFFWEAVKVRYPSHTYLKKCVEGIDFGLQGKVHDNQKLKL